MFKCGRIGDMVNFFLNCCCDDIDDFTIVHLMDLQFRDVQTI